MKNVPIPICWLGKRLRRLLTSFGWPFESVIRFAKTHRTIVVEYLESDRGRNTSTFRRGHLLVLDRVGIGYFSRYERVLSHSALIATKRTLAWLDIRDYVGTFVVVLDENGRYLGIDEVTVFDFGDELCQAVDTAAKRGRLLNVEPPLDCAKSFEATEGICATPESIADQAWIRWLFNTTIQVEAPIIPRITYQPSAGERSRKQDDDSRSKSAQVA